MWRSNSLFSVKEEWSSAGRSPPRLRFARTDEFAGRYCCHFRSGRWTRSPCDSNWCKGYGFPDDCTKISFLFCDTRTDTCQGIDAGEKEEFVRGLGAEAFFDVKQYGQDKEGLAKLVADVKAASADGLGAAAVVVCTASNAAYAQSVELLRFAGTVVCVGVPEGAPVPIAGVDPASMLVQEKRVVGSAVGNRKDAIETLKMAARGVVKTHFTVEPMSKLTDVFERMEKMALKGRVVLDLGTE